jgi:hypothetical protein
VSQHVQRASRQEILERLHRLVGPEAGVVVDKIVAYTRAGEKERGFDLLKMHDAKIGGVGLHNLTEHDLYDLYRPIRYVSVVLRNESPDDLTRLLVHAACGFVENVLKKMAHRGLWGPIRAELWPMGKLLDGYFKGHLPDGLFSDLTWLNRHIYNFAKHDFGMSDGVNADALKNHAQELDELPGGHLFDLDEAIAVYLIARRSVVELTVSPLEG